MERDLEDVFRPHFQNHHRRYNPFLGELVNQMVSSFYEEDLK
jgi:hypothetical protein